jgi:hypothetical protein
MSQLNNQLGMGRQGGMMSSASAPKVAQATKGAKFGSMENALLKGLSPDPKAMSGGSSGRQFYTQATGGDTKPPKMMKSKTRK